MGEGRQERLWVLSKEMRCVGEEVKDREEQNDTLKGCMKKASCDFFEQVRIEITSQPLLQFTLVLIIV